MRSKYMIILGLALAAVCAAGISAAGKPLASNWLIQALTEEISGENAYRYTARISQFDRIQASDGWHDAAVWIKTELEKMGYKDAAIESWPSNGSTRYYTYRTPIGWRAKKAELWMLLPRREKLCSFEEIPLTLVKHSGPARVEAELVDIGSGTGDESYRGKDVRGKIVLSYGASGEVMREAVQKRGALGVITYYPPDVRPGYPNMIRYTAFWPRWEERERVGFGFNVSKNQGATLKRMLEEGRKIFLKAEVEAEFYETKVEVLTASLPGRVEPDKEILIVGHLCHPAPSANDNASGSGGMLEMARALKKITDTPAVEQQMLSRTIRFLWVPEFAGTIPYIKAHLERTRNTLAVINCDMIGEDLHLTGGTFNITVTPDSNPSFLNDVVVNFAGLVDSLNLKSINGSDHPFAWRAVPFGGGSDHYVFNDGALRVPAVMFGHGDTFHHTSLDTMDKVDSTELRRVAFLTLAAVHYLAGAKEAEAIEMARLVARNGHGRISAKYYDALRSVTAALTPDGLYGAYKDAVNVLDRAADREKEAVQSTAKFSGGTLLAEETAGLHLNIQSFAAILRTDLNRIYAKMSERLHIRPLRPLSQTTEEKNLAKVIPARSPDFVCPLETDYLVEKLGAEEAGKVKLRGDAAYEALNAVDGKRSVLDIAMAVAASYSPLTLQDVHDFLKTLEKAGLMKLTAIK